MVDPQAPERPQPKVSNRISPLAILIVLALIAMVVIAVVRTGGHHVTPTGVSAPTPPPGEAVMPQQSNVTDKPQPMANTNDAAEIPPANSGR